MTAPRGKVPASLAESNWANERETATICGHTYAWFCQHRQELEAKGFPKRHPLIKKRPVHSIKAFLGLTIPGLPTSEPEEQEPSRSWG